MRWAECARIWTDSTNLRRLFAAGEAACTGVHGANRLASNSLLEGVVYGARAGRAMKHCATEPFLPGRERPKMVFPQVAESELRQLTWDRCGIVRTGSELIAAAAQLTAYEELPVSKANLALYDLRSIHLVAQLIARCALDREESRGAHYREDFPVAREEFRHASVVRLDE